MNRKLIAIAGVILMGVFSCADPVEEISVEPATTLQQIEATDGNSSGGPYSPPPPPPEGE